MGDIFGDAKISNNFLGALNSYFFLFFFFWGGEGGWGRVNVKCWTRAYE